VFALGLVDDLAGLNPSTKLVVEIAVASMFLWFGYRLHWTESLTLDTVVTLFWIVGMTNAFNLLDNMDGLCAGTALVVSAVLLVIFVQAGDSARAIYLVVLMGALSGFLVYNFNPASIFMGDTGSLFLGVTLGTMALETGRGPAVGTSVLSVIGAPVLALMLPIFDTTLVTVLRLLSGRRPSQGGRDHSSHRLVAVGLPERTAVAVLWVLSALGGLIALSLRASPEGLGGAAAAAFVLAMVIFAVYLARVRVYEPAEAALARWGAITPFVDRLMYKRRAAEVLLDVCLVSLSYYVAYRLRFEGPEFSAQFINFLASLPLVVGLQMLALFAVGAYRGVWQHFSLMDGVTFAKAVTVGTVSVVTALAFIYRFQDYSRGVFVIHAALLLLSLSGSRASFRLMSEFVSRRRVGERLVVYGAGAGGVLVVRELLGDEHRNVSVLGYVDDDASKHGIRVQGYPVMGGFDTLARLVEQDGVESVVVSARVLDVGRLADLKALCAANGVKLWQLHFNLEELGTT
jgi:UDP-GlcNAc:undecaprenyl-phosphate GlcNAc-1-phosphate transferase